MRLKRCILYLMGVMSVSGHTCGENKIPFGLEVSRDGQPALLCSKPECFEKTYADCDERAFRRSCEKKSWVGGFDKSYGKHQPLYLQCCEFENFDKIADPLYHNVRVRPGEFFEGEEIQDKTSEDTVAFDVITNMRLVRGPEQNISFEIDVARFRCADIIRHKKYKNWSWP
ncbi:unnamed protein product [Bursaphelenchus xylophilus]|uniref:(pine wood nematode) hypothetical protein n=1 Tax=Bursaphelenchus xylophilus TaxID=6326 RepID=A0A1I7RI39_BURXY|nr:unnamed protein product [Bursaphelenchus xylophilus]CAG9115174.1 unnamed protein product [Bursaphelenchus xylophilus]